MSDLSFRLAGVHRRTLASIATAALPERMMCGMDAVIDHVELSIGALPRPVRAALLAGLITYNQGARVFPRSFGRSAASLPADKARAYFASWWRAPAGPFREFARGIKGLIALGYYEQADVMADLGYTPHEWVETVKKRRLAVYKDDIERAAAAVFEPDPLPLGDADDGGDIEPVEDVA